MKRLTPKEFSRKLKKGVPQMSLLIGSEEAFILRTLKLIREALKVPAESVSELYGDRETSLERLLEELSSASLFSQERLVVLKKTGELLSRLSTREKSHLKSALKGLPPSTHLVLVEVTESDRGIDSHPVVKLLEGTDAHVVVCRKAKSSELKGWLKRRLAKEGLEDESLIEMLIEASGGSMEALEREVEKLLAGKRRDSILKEKTYTPFEVAELMLSGNWKAMDALRSLLASGTPPLLVLGAIQASLRNLILLSRGAREFHPYAASKMKRLLGRLGEEKVLDLYEESILLEKRMKLSLSGDLPARALEAFVAGALLEKSAS